VDWQIQLPDGGKLLYAMGKFDQFCVYHISQRGDRKPPRDILYFHILADLGARYGTDRIYKEFSNIYQLTTTTFNQDVASLILERAKAFGQDEDKFAFCFACIYLGMIAEENKAGTKLGKRIKRLGVHQILCEGMPVEVAANFSRGQKWQALDLACKTRRF
jgi:hypothetical protein